MAEACSGFDDARTQSKRRNHSRERRGLVTRIPAGPWLFSCYCRSGVALMGIWNPTLVPGGWDEIVYLVADYFGRHGRAWRETVLEAADLETIIP